MKRYTALLCAVLFLLAFTSCEKSKTGTSPTATPYERPTPTPDRGPYPWWAEYEGFSLFPMYAYGGKPEEGFENGPRETDSSIRFALKGVTYDDYKAYLEKLAEGGCALHNPYDEFVSQAEIDLAAFNGAATYLSEGYAFDLRYDLRMQTLIMQIER